MNILQECCRPIFGRHETFHPRWGWFSKAVFAAKTNPYVFQQPDAPLQLGVGKNMVRAIRYWGEASTLIKEVKPPKERISASSPTLRGEALLDPDVGIDPYLESPGSLWLLHWWMLQPVPFSMVPLAWYAFNAFRPKEFNSSDLEQSFYEECLKGGGEWKPPLNTLVRDTSCFLRAYVVTSANQIDDALDAPLRQLGLLTPAAGQKRRFRFQSPSWIPAEILLYCCSDFLLNIYHSASTVTMTRLLQEINSPGRVLKVNEDQLIRALSEPNLLDLIQLNDSIGTIQVVLKSDPDEIRWKALAKYFDCTDLQAKALASGGHDPLYGPSTLIERAHDFKKTRQAAIRTRSGMANNPHTSNDLLQRMEFSAALVEAGIRG